MLFVFKKEGKRLIFRWIVYYINSDNKLYRLYVELKVKVYEKTDI